MLVLARKEKESILIGDDIEIIIQTIDKDTVKLAIVAPKSIKVWRKELVDTVKQENVDSIISIDRNQLKELILQKKQEKNHE